MNSELRKAKNLSDKHLMLFLLMNEWVKVKQQGKSVSDKLLQQDIHKVAVYGMSYVGQRLCDELKGSDVKIIGCLDQKGGGKYSGYSITAADDIPGDIDAIIVTPVFYFDDIRKKLEGKTNAKIVSVEEIIYGLSESKRV